MNYLERTGQAVKFTEVQRAAVMAIVAACLESGRSAPEPSKRWNPCGTLFEPSYTRDANQLRCGQ